MSRLTRLFVPTLVQVVAVAMVACRDGTEPPTAPPAADSPALAAAPAGALAFRQLAAGDGFTCGVTTDDRAYCWGGIAPGFNLRPVPVAGGLRFEQVSAGGASSGARGTPMACGITASQRAYCWQSELIPAEVPGGHRFLQVSVGEGYACGVTPANAAVCWGVISNWRGQLGISRDYSLTPAAVVGGLKFQRVFTSATHTCGATLDHKGYCWGWAIPGEIGDGAFVQKHPKPTAVAGGLRFRQVKPGNGAETGNIDAPEVDDAYSCGIAMDYRAWCWGSGALGTDVVGQSRTPVAVAGGHHFDFVHPGLFHACALTLLNVAFCWGSNQDGQLGTGAVGGSSTTPVRVAGGLRFQYLTVGTLGTHTCGVTTDHKAYCWGSNGSGELGDGTHTRRLTPVAVVGPS